MADGFGNGELQPLFLQSQPRQEQQTRRQPSQHKPPMAKSMISKRLGGRVNGELDERLVGPPGQESGRRVPMTVNNAIEPNREKLVPSKALPTDRQTETGHFQKRPYRTPAHGTGITIVTVASPLDAACLPAQSTETGDLVDQTRASLKQPWQQTTRKRTQHQSHGRPSAGQHIQHQLVASDTSALRPSVDSSLAVGGSVGVEINDLSTGNSPESCSHPNHRHRHIHSHNHQHHSRRHQPQHRQPPQADQPILIQSEHQMEYFLAPAGPRTHLRQNNRQHKSHSDKQRMDRTTSTDRPTKQSVASDESALILEPASFLSA
ncbi:unnamed protein product [Protopolystoma xenopodis]|uniref:Uncharacterized protein n=1 Tax=Protopolystoma xenopodis TaxID=117903 RepID=A0A448WCL4_9PLAT|nr:unnamed protein product [Protopolystoma xenopodis]